MRVPSFVVCIASLCALSPFGAAEELRGWLNWRGPQQNGTSLEKGLPDAWEVGGKNHLWDIELQGRGTPVIADGRVYTWGYRGERFDLVEVLACLDEATGDLIWERRFHDFLSDIPYNRYAIGSPVIDAETRTLFLMTTWGQLFCFDLEGELRWERSMMEEFGRNVYPNGRTGAPTIERDFVVVRGVTNNWGSHAPPRDRLYTFDKRTGALVWSSTPGVGPPFLKDSSFATPYYDFWEGRRVLYTGIGSGAVVCVNAWSGEPIWRSQQIVGGINSSVVVYGGKVIAIHGKQNLDTTETGRLFALEIPDGDRLQAGERPFELGKEDEAWRLPLIMFTSSPVLVGDRLYQVTLTGDLHCIDVTRGVELWQKKLGNQQVHASPLHADGKLYVPLNEGEFYVLRPTDEGAQELARLELEGNCLGSPAAWNGKVYVHTTKRLYCFGSREDNTGNLPDPLPPLGYPAPGKAASLQIVPNEVVMRPGEKVALRVWALDAMGQRIGLVKGTIDWSHEGPGGMDATFDPSGALVAGAKARPSAGTFRATAGELTGTARGRIVPGVPFSQDFESIELSETHPDGVRYGQPPARWILGRVKWEVREHEGSKVLAKTTGNLIHHKAVTFVGHPHESDTTMTADVMTDGNRRGAGEVGLVHQRYIIKLRGNHDEIEVNSNLERFRVSVPFEVRPKTWYRMKTRVDVADDGTGVVRAKVWPRGDSEPEAWTVEAEHDRAHRRGAPGVFGFSPQESYRVYIDNLEVQPNSTKDTGP